MVGQGCHAPLADAALGQFSHDSFGDERFFLVQGLKRLADRRANLARTTGEPTHDEVDKWLCGATA